MLRSNKYLNFNYNLKETKNFEYFLLYNYIYFFVVVVFQ